MRPNSRLPWLDLARGLSALAVCIGHLRGVLFVDYASLPNSSLATKLVYAMTGLGHQAVMVFFVMSGYFVGGSVLEQGAAFRWAPYARARLVRLWIVLIPALFLTYAVDQVIATVAPETLSGGYYERWRSGPRAGEYSASPVTFLANVFFQQTISAPVFGTNGPLWSLANEACYYLVFPLVVFALGKGVRGTLLTRALCFLVACAVLAYAGAPICLGFVVWLFGAAVAYMTARDAWRMPGWLAWPCLAVLGAALGFDKLIGFRRLGINPDLGIGAAFALLLVALIHAPLPHRTGLVFARGSAWLSEISYSLYLFHYPFVILVGATLYSQAQLSPNALAFAALFGWLVALVVGAAAFWWLFERRTVELRAWLERRLRLQPTATLPSP